MKKFLALALSLAFTVSLLAGCGNQAAQTQQADPQQEESLQTIVFTEPVRGYNWAPVYLAQTLGYFKEQGLDAQFQTVTGADVAIFSGDAQFTLKGIEMALMANEGGQGCKIVASTGQKYPYQFIGAGAQYTTMESLKGGVAAGGQGANSGPQTFARTCLSAAGLTPDTDVSVISMASSGYAAAISAGEVQAVVGTNPWMSKTLVDNGGVVIVDGTDDKVMEQLIGSASYELFALVASDEYLAKDPDTVQKTVTAIAKAMQWMQTASPEDIAKNLLPLFENRYDELLYDAQYDKEHSITNYTGYHTESGYKAGVEMTKRAGGIKTDVPESAVYNETFLDNAWGELQQ